MNLPFLAPTIFTICSLAPGQDVVVPDVPAAPKQESVPIGEQIGQVQGEAEREVMWRAPTAVEWESPTLIRWERTWQDAVQVSLDSGKPILVCVNMDGEIASEHYAGVRYRQPQVAALYEPYVTVIASVYRHTPRDYDDEGRRVPCPRFGGVTCGEHIALEPIVYAKYLDEKRIAPRHIMVELDGSEVYDLYYAFDTARVFQTLYDGVEGRENPVPWEEQPELELIERITSKAAEDRNLVEQAFRDGGRLQRRELLQAAVSAGPDAPLDLLRLAIFGLDVEQAKLARAALAQSNDPAAVDLIAEALKVPMAIDEREPLLAALERLSTQNPNAGRLAVVYRGLGSASNAVDIEAWAGALAADPEPVAAYERDALEKRLLVRTRRASEGAEDGQASLEAADAALALAVNPETQNSLSSDSSQRTKLHRLMFEDVLRHTQRAEGLGAGGWRADALTAVAESSLGNLDVAFERATRAVQAMPVGSSDWSAMAALSLFVDGRRRAIGKRQKQQQPWPPEWLADMHAAYEVLARHPHGLDVHVVQHHDFLRSMGATGLSGEVLSAGLGRFSQSQALHARLRSSLLRDQGVMALMKRYEELLAQSVADSSLLQFAGYGALVAGEFERRTRRTPEALAAYGRAIELYEQALATAVDDPEVKLQADHFIAMAHAGRARVLFDAQADEEALEELIRGFERCPNAASTLDGMNLSAVMTAISLEARLRAREQLELAVRLRTALEALDPIHLERPAFDRVNPVTPPRIGRRAGGR